MVRAAVAGGGRPQIPPRSQRKTKPRKVRGLAVRRTRQRGGSGGTEAIRTRLLIVSRASSGEGSTGVGHAASPISRPRHTRLFGVPSATPLRCVPQPCPSGASATNPWSRWRQFWVFSGSPLDFAG
jgi:hypothetical protein